MKFLLAAINAKYIHSNPGVYSLRAFARTKIPGADIEIGEYTINHQMDLILQDIYRRKPDFIGFSCYIWNISYIMEIVRDVKKVLPEVEIWLGGPEVSYDAKKVLTREPDVCGVMRGEGELTFTELVPEYLKREELCAAGLDLDHIPGITYRAENGEIVEHGPQRLLSLDEIPFYYHDMAGFENRIVYYESSRGCPFSCSYCLSSIDKTVRFRSLGLVLPELQFFLDHKVPQVKFVDRTFNCKRDHTLGIWRYLVEHDNGITNFHFEISADLLNEEELALIHDMRPGLIQLEIGVQSTNEITIREIHRTMKLELLKDIVRKIQSGENIHEHLDLIAGLPYEDYATFAKSFDEIYALKPNQLQLGFLKVLKGSYMYEHAAEYEIVYHAKTPYEVMKTKWLSFDDVLKIKQVEEMLEVYYNSGQFEITMKVMEPLFDSAFAMFQELGVFYEEKGYFGMSHSRIRRAEILLEFMREQKSEDAVLQMLEESLTFDLYYRENCKSRPFWAPSPAEFKEQTRYYCKNGVKSHVEPFHYRFPEKSKKALNEIPTRLKQPVYMLFDYENRDPLDHQAHVTEVAAASMTEGAENVGKAKLC